jgi:methylenetetrahydrofolate reductase (NADPH)
MDKVLHDAGTISEKIDESTQENSDSLHIGEKSKVEVATDAVKSAASALTNGLNSLKLSS